MNNTSQCKIRRRVCTVALVIGVLVSAMAANGVRIAQAQDQPPRIEMDGAEYRLKLFEERVQRANGAPFELAHDDRDALRRIAALRQRYPDNPRVEEMYQRGRAALLASRGRAFEITPAMLAYRTMAQEVMAKFSAMAEQEWEATKKAVEATEGAITRAFPAPDPLETDMDDVVGKPVIVGNVEYPMNQFTHQAKSYLHVGGGATGIYFIDISGRQWLGAYEAVRRYRRFIGGEIPQAVKWSVAGEITGVLLAVPEAGDEPVGDAQFGWIVRPTVIYIPDFVLAKALPESELGGQFVGEDRIEEIKGPLYSLTSVPDSATPEAIVHAWFTVIKERNFELWKSMIDPKRRETGIQLSLLNYHWDWHLRRWAEIYAHYEIMDAPTVRVVAGKEIDPLEAEFLTEEEKAALLARSGPIERVMTFKIRLYDERGNQVRTPQNFYLRQYGTSRWWVESFYLPN